MAEEDNTASATTRTVGFLIIAAVAACVALYFGREFFIPIVFAFLLNAVFRPIMRGFEKLRVPPALGAAIVVLGATAALTVAGIALAGPIKDWLQEAPRHFEAAHAKFERVRRPFKQVSETASKIEQVAQTESTTQPAQPAAPQGPGLIARVFGTTTRFVSALLEVLLLLYLLLAAGDLFLQKLVEVMPTARDKRTAYQVVHEVESMVFRYLLVNAMINVAQGIIIALIMWMLHVPSPLLWGLFTVVLEFIPYLGAAIMICMLSVTAFATSDSLGHALMVPGIYFLVTTIQNNLVSPYAYGQRLKLNTVAVFIGVLFWWVLWGIAGAFLAVPIVATVKIAADRSSGLKAVGEFLGE